MEISRWCQENRVSLRQCLAGNLSRITYGELLKKIPKELWVYYGDVDLELEINRYQHLDWILQGKPSFVFIIASYNNIEYVERNLGSVFQQLYMNYRVIYIDDCSGDGTYNKVKEIVDRNDMWGRFRLCRQPVRNYQSGSRFCAYHLCDDDEILCMLDGDDWLSHNKVLTNLVYLYEQGAMVTYGSYQFYDGTIKGGIYGNEIFPQDILLKRNFRYYRWTSCHLRTGYAGLFKKIKLQDMLDRENRFVRCCTDLCEMYPVLEMASPYIKRCPNCLYIYNRKASCRNSNSFYNINKNPVEKLYREYVMGKIKSTSKYPTIDKNQLFLSMNLDIDRGNYWISNQVKDILTLLKLLKITRLNLIGMNLKIKHELVLYDNAIKIGRLLSYNNKILVKRRNYHVKINDLVISLDRLDIDIWDK